LAAADITIISNEIPFVAGCVPNNTLNNLILCSKPEYFASLEASGVDAVGLSGNHQNDFGYANMLDSLAYYQTQGIPVYGGGKDASAARAPIFLEHHGNRLAFLGANQYGPATYTSGTGEQVSAWAGSENPGSARFNLGEMVADIQSLSGQADLVLAEAQHTEFDAAGSYTIAPIPQQEADCRARSDAGAYIVTGVQAHAPQAVELGDDGVILYGLGNLYFDQTWSWATRTGLVPRHAIYDGDLINTELLVTVIEPDMQLRWATSDERIGVLRAIFDASRW
jgi:poly-gamma-glutamate synthesis protein (capsule biosynthesis protein)